MCYIKLNLRHLVLILLKFESGDITLGTKIMEVTVFNIVNTLQQFHSDLADYYFAQKELTHDTRVRSLLDYLGRSERYLENYIDRNRLLLSKETLKSTISIPSEGNDSRAFNLSDIVLSGNLVQYDKALSFAIRMDSMLANYCKLIKENARDHSLMQVFKNLCKVTNREKSNLFSYNNMFAD